MQLWIVQDPSPEAWNRVRRYASWMCQVCVDERSDLMEDAYRKFRLSSPPGGWFPALQELSWRIMEPNLPYIDLFSSPHLKRISIYTPLMWANFEAPPNILAAIASAVSTLPVPPVLRSLSIDIRCIAPPGYFKDSISSAVLRCGPSLTEFTTTVTLSDAAANHLIRLPHLRTWRIEGTPPSYSASSLPLVFPPLTNLILGKGAARGWLSLFQRLEDGISPRQGVTPLSQVKESLKFLDANDRSGLIINFSLISPIQIFRNLVSLGVVVFCRDEVGEGQCTFGLNDDNVTELAVALPQLETLFLGSPCADNTCATTVACLLPISVHCLKLRELQIHFNTTNIVDDFKDISKNPRFQEFHLLPRCTLSHLQVDRMPLILDKPGSEIAVEGILNIFPHLGKFSGVEQSWHDLSKRIAKFQRLSTLLAGCW